MAKNDIDIEQLLKDLEALETSADQLTREKQDMEVKLARLQADSSVSEELVNEATRRNEELISQVSDLTKKLQKTQSQFDDLVADYKGKYDINAIREGKKKSAAEIRKRVYVKTKNLENELYKVRQEMMQVKEDAEERVREANEARLRDVNRALSDEDVYTHIFNELIFPEFKYFKVVTAERPNSINPVNLGYAIKTAKKLDKKYNKEMRKSAKSNSPAPKEDPHSYNSILRRVSEKATAYVTSLTQYEEGQRRVEIFHEELREKLGKKIDVNDMEDVIEGILEQQSKWNFFSMVKSKRGIATLATTAATLAILSVASGVTAKYWIHTSKDLDRQIDVTQNVANVNDTVQNDYKALQGHVENAETINGMYGKEGVFAESKNGAVYNGIVVKTDGDKITAGYQQVAQAKDKAEEIISYNEDGTLNSDCLYAQAKVNYDNAVSQNNTEKISTYGQEINKYSQDMKGWSDDSYNGLSTMLLGANTTMDEFNQLLDILNAPTATIEFNDTLLSQYKKSLANPELKGSAVKVLSNEYVKDTGAVTIVVECKDMYGDSYINMINYKIDSKLMVIDAGQMLAPIKNGEKVKMTAFDQSLTTNIDNTFVQMSTAKGDKINGNASISYTIESDYNKKSNSTHFTATAIVTVTDSEGNVVGFNTVSTSTPIEFQGKVYATDEGVQETIEESLADELNRIIEGSVEIVSDSEAEL